MPFNNRENIINIVLKFFNVQQLIKMVKAVPPRLLKWWRYAASLPLQIVPVVSVDPSWDSLYPPLATASISVFY